MPLSYLASPLPRAVAPNTCVPATQTAALAQVTSVLSVGTHAARTLLIHHRWSVEALFAAYAEHGLEDTLRRAGVLSRADADAEQATSAAAGAPAR